MSKNDLVSNLTERKSNQPKLKLNSIWNELQQNLPSIDFEDDKADPRSNDDDLDLVYNRNAINFLDTNTQLEDEMLHFSNRKEFNGLIDHNLIDDNDDVHVGSIRQSFDTVSVNEVYLDNEATNRQSSNIMLKLESMDGRGKNYKNVTNLDDSVKSATKITKSMFDSTNTKLKMDIFETFNIDEALETFSSIKNSTEPRDPRTGNSSQSNSSRLINEENVMKKLAEMSMQYNKPQRDETNNSFKSTSSSSISLSNNPNDLTKKLNKEQSNFLGSAFKLMERELADDSNLDKLNKKAAPSSTENEMRAELKNFLRDHNIKDGNLVETRRIDLRSNQSMPSNTKQKIYSKQTFERFFESIVLNDEKDAKIAELMQKNNSKIRFLNEVPDSSSEFESDEENDSSLWIERYRKQKLAISKK